MFKFFSEQSRPTPVRVAAVAGRGLVGPARHPLVDLLHRNELVGVAIRAGEDREVRLRLVAVVAGQPAVPPGINREVVVKLTVPPVLRGVAELAGRREVQGRVRRVACAEVVLEVAVDAAVDCAPVIELRTAPLARCCACLPWL